MTGGRCGGVIWIDEEKSSLKFLHNFDKKSGYKFENAPIERELIQNGEWVKAFADGAKNLCAIEDGLLKSGGIGAKKENGAFGVTLVLPDRLVVSDMQTVPTISSRKRKEALETQIKEQYSFAPDLKFKSRMLQKSAYSTVYRVVGYNTAVLNGIQKALAGVGLYGKCVTYSSAAALNAVFAINKSARGKSFMLLDIGRERSSIAVCDKGGTVGFLSLDYGVNVLTCGEAARVSKAEEENNRVLSAVKRRKRGGKVGVPLYDEIKESDAKAGGFKPFADVCLQIARCNAISGYLSAPSVVFVNVQNEFEHVFDEINENAIEDMKLVLFKSSEFKNELNNGRLSKQFADPALLGCGLPMFGGFPFNKFGEEDVF